eukprot:3915014-Rhodomonas_salina.1
MGRVEAGADIGQNEARPARQEERALMQAWSNAERGQNKRGSKGKREQRKPRQVRKAPGRGRERKGCVR